MENTITFKKVSNAESCLLWLHNSCGFLAERNDAAITFSSEISGDDFADLKKMIFSLNLLK